MGVSHSVKWLLKPHGSQNPIPKADVKRRVSICVGNQQCHSLIEKTVKEERRWKGRNREGERRGEGIRHTAALDSIYRGRTSTEMGEDMN